MDPLLSSSLFPFLYYFLYTFNTVNGLLHINLKSQGFYLQWTYPLLGVTNQFHLLIILYITAVLH